MLLAILWTPKRHFLTSQRVFEPLRVKIHLWVSSVGESWNKNKSKKEEALCLTYLLDAPLQPIGTNFGLRVSLVDVINCAKFYHSRLSGLDSVRGRILPFPLDCDVTVNTV